MASWFLRLRRQQGQDLVEYALIMTMIALCATLLIDGVGANVVDLWTAISTTITTAVAAI